jgi:signal transduction histidine kinase
VPAPTREMADDEQLAGQLPGHPAEHLGMQTAVLDELCPFFFVVDRELRPLRVGHVLARLLPDLTGSGPLTESFDVERPRLAADFAAFVAAHGRLAMLRSRSVPGLLLRGQFTELPGRGELLFFGAPAATNLAELVELGLQLQDFPAHLGLADYLLVAQTQATTVLEAKAMAERLRALNTQLEQRVAERTRRLQAGNTRLARYSSELEKMSERLQHEIAERTRVEAERTRMEEDLRLAHKLEAVGQLAAGVAHEINTPVQFVGHNLRFLQMSLTGLVDALAASASVLAAHDARGEDAALATALERARQATADADLEFLTEELPRAVDESLEGIERVGQIVRAMKEFAHPGIAEFQHADINKCIATTLIVSHNEYRHVADLVTELDPDLPDVRCVPGEINQVLLNLVVNAAHAVAEMVAGTTDRGIITVSTRRRGDHVEISVKDTGPGIPVHVRNRIFEPFFTTKQVGPGSGQGLSTCRAIVTTRHAGRLDFTTELGTGTEFTVLLPVDGPPVPPEAA